MQKRDDGRIGRHANGCFPMSVATHVLSARGVTATLDLSLGQLAGFTVMDDGRAIEPLSPRTMGRRGPAECRDAASPAADVDGLLLRTVRAQRHGRGALSWMAWQQHVVPCRRPPVAGWPSCQLQARPNGAGKHADKDPYGAGRAPIPLPGTYVHRRPWRPAPRPPCNGAVFRRGTSVFFG